MNENFLELLRRAHHVLDQKDGDKTAPMAEDKRNLNIIRHVSECVDKGYYTLSAAMDILVHDVKGEKEYPKVEEASVEEKTTRKQKKVDKRL